MRGKKTPPEVICQVLTAYVACDNYMEVSKKLDIPYSTVKDIVLKNKDKDEYVKLREEKMEEFSHRASEIIMKGMRLLNGRLDRAINSEEELDILIDEIFATNKEELSYPEKQSLIAKVRSLQLYDVKALTTAIGTLFDKKAMADGKPTGSINLNFAGEKVDKLAEIAGFKRI